MNMVRISVNKGDYERRPGKFVNLRSIAEYSLTAERNVLNNRTNARYLIEDNIRDDVFVDLEKGFRSPGAFIDKTDHMEGIAHLQEIVRWAVGQNAASMKEVFGGADFASKQGTLKRIALTLANPRDAWRLCAQDLGGVILLSEPSVKYYRTTEIATYAAFKFKQFMTANEPNGRSDDLAPVDIRRLFELMVRSDLEVNGQSLKLCYGGEVDALCGEEPVELKTAKYPTKLFRDLPKLMQAELLGVRRLVIGVKGEHNTLIKVIEMSMEEWKRWHNREKPAHGYSFLFSVLSEIKKFLASNEACWVEYNPTRSVVEIRVISRHEAKDKFGKEEGENGSYITETLMTHFNL